MHLFVVVLFQGSVFLLPTVSPEEADSEYPGYHTCDLPSKKPYLRLVKPENVGMDAPAPAKAAGCSIM